MWNSDSYTPTKGIVVGGFLIFTTDTGALPYQNLSDTIGDWLGGIWGWIGERGYCFMVLFVLPQQRKRQPPTSHKNTKRPVCSLF